MAYTTTALTNASLGANAAAAGTQPTIQDLSQMIDDISSHIDTVLSGQGVATVPVTITINSTFYNTLVLVNRWGAAAQFLKAMYPEAIGPGESPAFAYWQKLYDDTIKAWRDGKDIPADLLGGSNDIAPSTYFTRNPDEEETLGDLAQNADRTRMEDRF